MAKDLGNPKVTVTSPAAKPPKSTARIAGLDYSPIQEPPLCDDFVQGGVTKKNSPGGPYGSGR